MADAQGILQRVFDDGAQALRVLLGGTVSDDAPSSPVEGDFWYESDTGSFFVRVGGSWVEIAAGTGTLPGLSDVTVTAVADNEVLAYDSGTSEWINQTPSEAGLVAKADYDANTILAATSDNTPAALTVAEQRIVGRKTGGNIDDLTGDEVQAIIDAGIEDWHYVGESGEPAFAGSFSNLGFGQPKLCFRKIGNEVHIAGTFWEGGGALTVGTVFTLPTGYRPSGNSAQVLSVYADFSGNSYFQGMTVSTAGVVAIAANPGSHPIMSAYAGSSRFPLDPPDPA